MTLEPLKVDSIKERIVRSVHALGPLATKVALGRAVVCDSAVLSIAIEALHRDGYLYVGEAGHYVVADEIKATLPAPTPVAPPARAVIATIRSTPSEVADMPQRKICPACTILRSLDQFERHARRCNPCVANGVQVKKGQAPKKKKKNGGKAPSQSSRKLNGARPAAAPLQADELVIPAAGQIRCRVFDAGAGPAYSLHQGADQLTLSREQLQALHGWAGAVLKT